MYNSASILLVNILSIKAHGNNPGSSGFNFLNDSLQGNCPRRTEEMVISSVCLPVRFAGST